MANSGWKDRYKQRYRIAKELGETGARAKRVASCNAEWLAMLARHGKKPEEYGDLSVKMIGGKPRRFPERGLRYRALREMGARASTASSFCQSEGLFQLASRQLAKGLIPTTATPQEFDLAEAKKVLRKARSLEDACRQLYIERKSLKLRAKRHPELQPLLDECKKRGLAFAMEYNERQKHSACGIEARPER